MATLVDEGRVTGDRALAAWEIVSVVSSVLVAEWVVFSVGGESQLLLLVPVALAFVLMFVSHYLRGESAREVGWRLDNFLEAARLLLMLLAVPALLLLAFGWLNSTLNPVRWSGGQSILGMPALGVLWGLLQQYALQGFINRRAQILWGRGWVSVFVVALVFGGLHLPNPVLTLATFAGGLVWAYAYQRAPNLLALGLSHGLMTWVLISSLPPASLYNLRVGFKFFG
ncbi:MAG TPA: CPBP family intramembrane glutamic endopeptidase [Pyrinomonadaceae bacterium]|nr:CPBP family intramembrane glutamic endopeptidase [Pyrinomonadaceae bacterium]